jgi:hypothetical protein
MNKQNTRSRKPSSGKQRRDALTDIPKPPPMDWQTVSCRLPRISSSTTIRSQSDDLITATAGSVVSRGFNFTLAGANIGSGFYDQYRIDAIRFNVVPRNNAVGVQIGLSDLFLVIDYDDSTALTSTAQAQAFSTVMKLAPGESASRTFSPRIAVAAYNGAFSGFLNQGPQWIDAASNTIQHYGIKIYVPATGVVGQTVFQQWDINIEYFISFKHSIG